MDGSERAFVLYPRHNRRVGYRKPFPQTCRGTHSSVRVPHVRTSVRGPKTMGEALRQPLVPDRTLSHFNKRFTGTAFTLSAKPQPD
jgi:hypothetical protein